jgi:excisionase family DNA binding protein
MAKAKTSPDDLLSTPEVAAELGLSVTRVQVFINKGRLPARRVGKVWAVRRGDLALLQIGKRGRPLKAAEDKQTDTKKKRP